MLQTRLWMGSLLVALALGVLVADLWLAPWYPVLQLAVLGATLVAGKELISLLPPPQPRAWLCFLGIGATVLSAWPAQLGGVLGRPLGEPWHWLASVSVGFLMLAFLVEAAYYREPGGTIVRLGLSYWVVGYLGILPWFFVQMRWLPGMHGSIALALAVFVPKVCDIGAYFTGRFLGRHRMAPILSPKKTWEGAIGGLAAAVVVALGINALGGTWAENTLLSWPSAVGFGLVVGAMGMLGDLMESLIKRDTQHKDASESVPGFGGVLDVLDSIIFSAPVAYLWIALGAKP